MDSEKSDGRDESEEELAADFEKLTAILKRHVKSMSLHFDSVQVVCTFRTSRDSTGSVSEGAGNFYARSGSVREWLEKFE
jgi:uncharacterized protein (DUF2461 family)